MLISQRRPVFSHFLILKAHCLLCDVAENKAELEVTTPVLATFL